MRSCVSRAIFIALTVTLLSLTTGCSDQPKQVRDRNAVAPNPAGSSAPLPIDEVDSSTDDEDLDAANDGVLILDNVFGREPTEIRIPRVLDGNVEEMKIETNGKKPVVFDGSNPKASSVAGVAFSSTYDEASDILSTPLLGACGSLGDYYQESLCFLWTDDEPKRLRQINILQDYLGTISFPEPIGDITMSTELRGVFTSELGEDLLQKTFNKFFEKEETYNCLETQECQAVLFNNYINWIIPNGTIIFSADRKVLIRVIIDQDVQPGDFQSPFDLVTGEFKVGEGDSAVSLKLGETWGETQAKLSEPANPESILETKYFRKDFVGSRARVLRNGVHQNSVDFSLEKSAESNNDIFYSYTIFSNYNEPVMIAGKFVKVIENANEPYFELSATRPEEGQYLTVRMDKFSQNIKAQKSLIKSLGEQIKKEYEALSVGSLVNIRYFGFNAKPSPNRLLGFRADYFDSASNRGMSTYTHVGSNSGGFLFSVSLENDPAYKDFMQTVASPVDLVTDSLAGVSLGESIRIFDIDRERNEGFIELNNKVIRVELDLFDSATVATDRDLLGSQEMVSVTGVSGVFIGLSPNEQIVQDTKELTGSITYLASSSNANGVTNICGSSEVFETGMTQKTFERKLRDIIRANAKSESPAPCNPFVGPDRSGDGEVRAVYFPNYNRRVYFSDKVLAGVAKYTDVSGGNQ